MFAPTTVNKVGGVYSIPPAPAYPSLAVNQELWRSKWTRLLYKHVQDHFLLEVSVLRVVSLDCFQVTVKVINQDWSLHGEIEELVRDPDEFPSQTFLGQLMMLAG
jgi:hypothetical protein